MMRRAITSSFVALVTSSVIAGAQVAQPAARVPADTGDRYNLDRVAAIVGDKVILWSEVIERRNADMARNPQIPQDSAGQMAYARRLIEQMLDDEVLVQFAQRDTSVHVSENDVSDQVERQIKNLREHFKSDVEMAKQIKDGGFGSPEEYRRWLAEQARRGQLMQKYMAHMRQDGKVPPVPVSEEDVLKVFEEEKDNLPKRPPTVSFRQIVVPSRANDSSKAAAKAKADSLLDELKRGGDFEQLARRESMDPTSKELGGDLGWNRRGQMIEPFNTVMFALQPGMLSPVVETSIGFHIIRVDRARPGEVKVRHILIRPKIDSAAVQAARLRADSVLAQWRAGVSFDSLAARYNDPDEEKAILEPMARDSLPESYQRAFAGKKTGDFVEPFSIDDRVREAKKYVVAQIVSAVDAGAYTPADFRTQIRDDLGQQRAIRRFIDGLRTQTFITVRIE